VFVAADEKLCRVAAIEGFAVTNPEHPGLNRDLSSIEDDRAR
jgi:hypothetical protein